MSVLKLALYFTIFREDVLKEIFSGIYFTRAYIFLLCRFSALRGARRRDLLPFRDRRGGKDEWSESLLTSGRLIFNTVVVCVCVYPSCAKWVNGKLLSVPISIQGVLLYRWYVVKGGFLSVQWMSVINVGW